MNPRKVLSIVVVLLASLGMRASGGNSLSAEDMAKIKRVHSRYEEAWLKGDADGVRSLFTDDCVLLPPHGDTPRMGQKGLGEYWFPPDALLTQITKLVVTPQGIGGDGQVAYVWGTHEVEWTTTEEGQTTHASHRGVFLNVLRKQADGEWKMSHHMWDEPVNRH